MEKESEYGAGRVILISSALAVLLLWMDGWSHSVPVVAASTLFALLFFLAFRNVEAVEHLSHAQRIARERESALRWMERDAAARNETVYTMEPNDG